MPSITIKDIPDDLLERLHQRAAADKRSINREIINLLDAAEEIEQIYAARTVERQIDPTAL